VFAGLEYCKVTLFDKREKVQEILNQFSKGRFLALGDSAVDVPFLLLQPAELDYQACFVGGEKYAPTAAHIEISTEFGPAGSCSAIRRALQNKEGGAELTAIIADIDNCIASLDQPITEEMRDLLKQVLKEGVQLFLITGGEYPSRYIERVLNPLLA